MVSVGGLKSPIEGIEGIEYGILRIGNIIEMININENDIRNQGIGRPYMDF
jgi:hypothetical protein